MNCSSLSRWWGPVAVAVCLVALSGCGDPIGPDGVTSPSGGEATSSSTPSDSASSAPSTTDGPAKVEESKYVTTKSGLKYAILKPGKGEAAKSGEGVSVHYTGWLQSNGKKFDSSRDRNKTFEFPLGGGQVIKGWDEGIVGMKPGEQRQLVIPAALGYGDRGQGEIPPGATLVFDVELIYTGG